jgi:hypothetical protein
MLQASGSWSINRDTPLLLYLAGESGDQHDTGIDMGGQAPDGESEFAAGSPLARHHFVQALLSPVLSLLLPPSQFGLLALLLSMLPSVNTMIVEEAVRGISLLASSRHISSAVGTYALPLLAAMAADDGTPHICLPYVDEVLRSKLGFAKGIRDVTDTCGCSVPLVLFMWQARWSLVAQRRAALARFLSKCHAWEAPRASKPWKTLRSKMSRLELPAGVLVEMLRGAGVPIPPLTGTTRSFRLSMFYVVAFVQS